MTGTRRWLYWASLALPLAGYFGFIAWAEARRSGAPLVTLAIEGYDPRDPLRGHYLQYRFAFEGTHPETMSSWSRSRSCVVEAEQGTGRLLFHPEGERPSRCLYPFPAEFARQPHRFYVQQDRARALESAVRNGQAAVRVHLIGDDQVAIDELLIAGRPVGEAKLEEVDDPLPPLAPERPVPTNDPPGPGDAPARR